MRSMRHRALRRCLAVLIASRQGPLAAQSDPLRTEALQARDRADPQSLDATIRRAQAEAEHASTASAFVEVALFEDWMCEVAKVRDDGTLLRHAAEAGVSAARQAVKLAPDSSDAHWLLGDLLGQLIPLVFAGGVRHGAESTAELDRAIQLNPKNADAYVSRAHAYYFAPGMFGGSKSKAKECLDKAITIAPFSDVAATAYISLAQFDLAESRRDEARKAISTALELAPYRQLAHQVEGRISRK